MALSSGSWALPAPVPASSLQPACSGPGPAACCSTVLMSVRVSVSHSGIRPLCLPGAGSDSLRLQLSMDPNLAGEFRLALRDMSGNRSVVRFHLHTCLFTWGLMVNPVRKHRFLHIYIPPSTDVLGSLGHFKLFRYRYSMCFYSYTTKPTFRTINSPKENSTNFR